MRAPRYRWPQDPGNTRVLVVEDDTSHQLLLRTYLSRLDHSNIAVARNAEDALRELALAAAAIAFLDIHLVGETTGMGLLERLSALAEPPFVVMMTADSTLVNVERAIALGARFFIAKPFAGKKVHEALERYYQCACPLL